MPSSSTSKQKKSTPAAILASTSTSCETTEELQLSRLTACPSHRMKNSPASKFGKLCCDRVGIVVVGFHCCAVSAFRRKVITALIIVNDVLASWFLIGDLAGSKLGLIDENDLPQYVGTRGHLEFSDIPRFLISRGRSVRPEPAFPSRLLYRPLDGDGVVGLDGSSTNIAGRNDARNGDCHDAPGLHPVCGAGAGSGRHGIRALILDVG